MHAIVVFDTLRVNIRDADSRLVKNKAVYVALGGDRLISTLSFSFKCGVHRDLRTATISLKNFPRLF